MVVMGPLLHLCRREEGRRERQVKNNIFSIRFHQVRILEVIKDHLAFCKTSGPERSRSHIN